MARSTLLRWRWFRGLLLDHLIVARLLYARAVCLCLEAALLEVLESLPHLLDILTEELVARCARGGGDGRRLCWLQKGSATGMAVATCVTLSLL